MGILSRLFGGGKAIEDGMKLAGDAVRGVGRWIDEQQLTEQERIELKQKAADMMLQMIKATRDENSVRSITRRYLAWAIMSIFLVLVIGSAIAYPFSQQYAEYLFKLASQTDIGWLAAGVGGFYFLAHVVRARK